MLLLLVLVGKAHGSHRRKLRLLPVNAVVWLLKLLHVWLVLVWIHHLLRHTLNCGRVHSWKLLWRSLEPCHRRQLLDLRVTSSHLSHHICYHTWWWHGWSLLGLVLHDVCSLDDSTLRCGCVVPLNLMRHDHRRWSVHRLLRWHPPTTAHSCHHLLHLRRWWTSRPSHLPHHLHSHSHHRVSLSRHTGITPRVGGPHHLLHHLHLLRTWARLCATLCKVWSGDWRNDTGIVSGSLRNG